MELKQVFYEQNSFSGKLVNIENIFLKQPDMKYVFKVRKRKARRPVGLRVLFGKN